MNEQQEQDITELNRHAEYYSIHHPSSDAGMCLRRFLAHVKELEQDLARLRNILPHTDRVGLRYESACMEIEYLRQQRDAALKLADKWEADERYSSVLPRHALSDCARELRAIFAPKEGK